MHYIHLWALRKKYWLVLFVAATCVILGSLVLPAQYIGGTIGKYITCTVVSVVDVWATGVFVFLYKWLGLWGPKYRCSLLVFVSASVLSMVGCWVATAPPLTFEVYVPVSFYRMGC